MPPQCPPLTSERTVPQNAFVWDHCAVVSPCGLNVSHCMVTWVGAQWPWHQNLAGPDPDMYSHLCALLFL